MNIPLQFVQGEKLTTLPRLKLPDASSVEHDDVPGPAGVAFLSMAH